MKEFKVYREKYGFVKDKDMVCTKHPLSGKILKQIYIDVCMDNPYTLLSRVDKKDVYTVFDGERIIFRGKDNKTISNILKESIDDWAVKIYDDSRLTLILSISNLCYRISITK